MVLAGIECSPKIFDFRANGIPTGESVDFFDTLTVRSAPDGFLTYIILFVGNPVRKGHKTVPEMDVLNLNSGIFERNIVMTEIPERLNP